MGSFHYLIRTTQKEKDTDVMVRICYSSYVDKKRKMSYAKSGVKVTKSKWDKKGKIKDKYTALGNINNAGSTDDNKQTDLNEIQSFVNNRYNLIGDQPVTSQWLQGVVDEYWDIRGEQLEAEQRAKEELANRETLNQYIARYIKEAEAGARLTNRGTKYATSSIKATKASLAQFEAFQKATRKRHDFDDIDMDFYRRYTAWLGGKGYTNNSIGKCIKDLKNILNNAKDDKLHTNEEYTNKRFKVLAEEADNIYLTMAELEAIEKVDLSSMPQGYSDARDVFLAGCWLAQRVSDYNHLSPENIKTEKRKIITENDIVKEVDVIFVELIQQKTKTRVRIPANQKLRAILARHHNNLPFIWEQKLNQYIKEIGKLAGITQEVEIRTTRGNEHKVERIEKYKLIMSHTARRTGATLMYLSDMNEYDISKITGHTSTKTLRRYIKADELDVAEKIIENDFFQVVDYGR